MSPPLSQTLCAIAGRRAHTPRLVMVALAALGLSACNTVERLSEVGRPPELAPADNQVALAGYQPVNLPMPMPMPVPADASFQPNSLWREGSRAFFRDQRAKTVGDILTIEINIDDQARLNNSSSRSRDNEESAGLPNFLGFEDPGFSRILPDSVQPDALIAGESTSSSTGAGEIDRNEEIRLKVAAVIVQILPNGNMVIQGRQQVRVNYELRELYISGVIRPEDIESNNTISHEKVAEARISYGGRGHISDVQQPRYGQQIYDILFPF